MLTNKIEILEDTDSDATDIFEQSLFTIFADSRNQHGEPGQYVVYKSGVYGDLKLRLADPDPSNNSLFAHFLWNAGLQAAEIIITGEISMANETVLEFGAGAGLPGIVSALSGAKETVLSDYPAEELLSNIRQNVLTNTPPDLQKSVSVIGHVWGDLTDPLCESSARKFTRVIAADCMWMDWQHENLCASINRILAEDGLVIAIAGFHTGRKKLAAFFDATEAAGLVPVKPVMERDVEGNERPWVRDRGEEDRDLTERKRWLVIAILRRPM
ncbi:hypothetical protein RUND412_007542 [Rhizina undulata]